MDVRTISYADFIDHLFVQSGPTWLGSLDAFEDDLKKSVVGARFLARLFHTAPSSLAHLPEHTWACGFDAVLDEGWIDVFWERAIPWPERRSGIAGVVPVVAGFLAVHDAGDARKQAAHRLCHLLAWGYNGIGPKDADDALVQTELLHAFMTLLRLRASEAAESAATEGVMHLEHPETARVVAELMASDWAPLDPRTDRYLTG